MLEVETFDSHISNAWLVRQFENYSFEGSPVTDKFIPRPYISLVFHFKECPYFVDDISFLSEPIFLAPVIPRAISLKFHGYMDTLVVTCKATVFSRLFTLDLTPTPKRIIDLPNHIFFPLWLKMAGFNNSLERINCFTEFINSTHPMSYVPDVMDVFYDKIVEKSITMPLKEIMRECSASKSTLIRKFIKRTGVSPKDLARIVRLNYVWSKILNGNDLNFQDLVFYGNYFDQSHFINDFKAIIGETPGHFFHRNLDIVKIFYGKNSK